MPKNAAILSVHVQNDNPCLWVWVNPSEENESRKIAIYGTGNPIPLEHVKNRIEFIGTFFSHQDTFVWHVFEVLQ
jgi:hypothetical protein